MLTPNFITRDDVLSIHADQIESFGGTLGLRDEGLLDSALAQPKASFAGELLHKTISQQAAAYLYHLAMNHPFIDGNKRTAFAVMDVFLRVNGYRLAVTDDDAYLPKRTRRYGNILHRNSKRFIATKEDR